MKGHSHLHAEMSLLRRIVTHQTEDANQKSQENVVYQFFPDIDDCENKCMNGATCLVSFHV